MANFAYSPMFPITEDTTEYEQISSNHVHLVKMDGETFLRVDPAALTLLAERAFADISHLLRSSHLGQLANILKTQKPPKMTVLLRWKCLKMR